MPGVAQMYEVNDRGRLVDGSADHGDRVYAMVMHLTLLAGHALMLVGPVLVMWLIRRKESGFLDDHGKEALNFQITLLAYGVTAFALSFVWIGLLLYPVIYVLGIVGMVLAARAANRGEFFRYPATLRFVN
ncbi:MAG: DUF4870 domain-containing protein [Phycisphaerales bacterium]|nr:DUF4870 domain-containing protein [Phycisphaerales bacterium]